MNHRRRGGGGVLRRIEFLNLRMIQEIGSPFLSEGFEAGRTAAGRTEAAPAFGALGRYHVRGGEYWRLLTAVFLHVGWIHLLWNTFGMFSRCADIEQTVGSAWFVFAYLSTGIGASAVSLLSHNVLSAGASGAGFGMIAVTLSILYRRAGAWDSFIANPLVRRILGPA